MERTGLIPANSTFTLVVEPESASDRVDKYLSRQFPLYSRSFFQKLINDGYITINGAPLDKSSVKLKTDDTIVITFPEEPTVDLQEVKNRDLGIEIVYQGKHFLIIHKPANLLVHRASSKSGAITLVDWLLAHYKDIASVGYVDRPGIVHRLDKDTSGLLIIPLTNYAHSVFTDLFKNRTIQKTYYAIVHGHPPQSGTIDRAIGRHPVKRTSMKAFDQSSSNHGIRHAITHYKVLEYYPEYALIQAKPVTGRTHQIRVHLASIGHPIVGDPIYGRKSKFIKRHALHAAGLFFTFDGTPYTFTLDLPDDMKKLIRQVKTHETKK